MKTILVTGAAGYIGRHVVKKALDMGYRVIASDFAFKRWASLMSASIWPGGMGSATMRPAT